MPAATARSWSFLGVCSQVGPKLPPIRPESPPSHSSGSRRIFRSHRPPPAGLPRTRHGSRTPRPLRSPHRAGLWRRPRRPLRRPGVRHPRGRPGDVRARRQRADRPARRPGRGVAALRGTGHGRGVGALHPLQRAGLALHGRGPLRRHARRRPQAPGGRGTALAHAPARGRAAHPASRPPVRRRADDGGPAPCGGRGGPPRAAARGDPAAQARSAPRRWAAASARTPS